MSKVTIQAFVLAAMLEHAREAWPIECCGLLTGQGTHTSGIRRATNERLSTSTFFIPPPELFDFFRSLRATGEEFTGIYHSHPNGPAIPSTRDTQEFHYREVCYWIISLEGPVPDIRCYRWGTMTFEEIGYEVVVDSLASDNG